MSRSSAFARLPRSGDAAGVQPALPAPRFRWTTRVLLPLLLLSGAAAVLLWTARDAVWPAIDVRVVPVVLRPAGVESGEAAAGEARPGPERVLVQAPGWIEPDPFAVTVPALIDGIVKEVLVLEGEPVEEGQVVARLIDDEARLVLRREEAQLAERSAAIVQARAQLEAWEARSAATRDEVDRKRPLAAEGTVSSAQFSRLELQLLAVEADVASARAAVHVAEGARGVQEVVRDEAALALARHEVRSSVAGIVLSRAVEPGTRVMTTGGGGTADAGIVRVYNPGRLQVRVDVPLADAAKIGVGTAARIVTESLPDVTFRGTVVRVVHEANIQRNTVQFKVVIESPDAALKPEMLVRVRLVSTDSSGPSTGGAEPQAGDNLLLIHESVVIDATQDSGAAWVVRLDGRGQTVASRRSLRLGRRHEEGYIEVDSGLQATDRAIHDPPPGLREGARVRVLGETGSATGGGA